MKFLPSNREIAIDEHTDLLTAAINSGVYISSACGGEGTCGRCKVVVKKGKFSSESSHWLSAEEKAKNYVLACATQPLSDLEVFIPIESRLEKIQVVTGQEDLYTSAEAIEQSPVRPEEKIFAHSPLVNKHYLPITPPSLENNRADLERLYSEIKKKQDLPVIYTSLPVLRRIGKVFRQSDWKVTASMGERDGFWELLQLEAGDTSKKSYGIALDVGTTTVVTYLVDLNKGEILGAKASYNRQMSFGDDVITRISYAEKEEGLETLHKSVVETINDLIWTLSQEKGVSLNDILVIQSAGNTTMLHLLLQIPPVYIRKQPYIPTVNFPPVVRAQEVGIKINPRGLLSCLPGIASYVGGDITAGVLACGMDNFSTISLLIDLGTNGEMVLGNKDWLVTCACSAGPAFEGVGIKCGIRAMEGAIQRVEVSADGKNIDCDVIGNVLPKGICGSGLVDIPGEFLKKRIINREGRFIQGSSPFIRKGENCWEFVLVAKEKSATGQDIVINEDDLQTLIRSKGAIYLGAQVMLEQVGLSFDNLAQIYISGGFGTYLNIEKAILIGLLPDLPRDKFHFIGNSSITGAKMCLLSRQARQKAQEIAKKMTYIELSTNPKFMNDYTATLFLPHTNIELFPTVKKILDDKEA
ncbi:MAG: ASKHA domain-containing protein [Elusimicrobiota bacterium]